MTVFPGQYIRKRNLVVNRNSRVILYSSKILTDVHQAVFASACSNQRLENYNEIGTKQIKK